MVNDGGRLLLASCVGGDTDFGFLLGAVGGRGRGPVGENAPMEVGEDLGGLGLGFGPGSGTGGTLRLSPLLVIGIILLLSH